MKFNDGDLVEFNLGPGKVARGRVIAQTNGAANGGYSLCAIRLTRKIPDYEWSGVILPESFLRKLTLLDELSDIL